MTLLIWKLQYSYFTWRPNFIRQKKIAFEIPSYFRGPEARRHLRRWLIFLVLIFRKSQEVSHQYIQSAFPIGGGEVCKTHRWKKLWDAGTKSQETLLSWQKVFGKYHAYFAGFDKMSAPLAKNDWKLLSDTFYWLTNQYFFNFHWIRLTEMELANKCTKKK